MKEYMPLKRQEIIDVIEGKSAASRVPINFHFWIHQETFGDREEQIVKLLDKYPEDFQAVNIKIPTVFKNQGDDIGFHWLPYEDDDPDATTGIDNKVGIKEWEDIDLEKLELPNFDSLKCLYDNEKIEDERYLVAYWWFGFFETHWKLRGMTNALMDFYIYPEKVHVLYRHMLKHFKKNIDYAKKDLNPDGIFFSDDLGTQSAPFFSLEIFNTFFKPYYEEFINYVHKKDMHFWLHTCGNVEPFIPIFIDLCLDVLHPIQKYTMEEKKIAEKYGDKICIWAGFDVQQVIPWGSADEVRREVRFMVDTYKRDDGRFMLTAGNGINEDCRVDALEALFDEVMKYN